MHKKRKHRTTKNTIPKPPVKRLMVIRGDVNGPFELVTDLVSETIFDKLYHEWFDHPSTKIWCVESLIMYIKDKHPDCICLLKKDYDSLTKGKVIEATKEEWEAENN